MKPCWQDYGLTESGAALADTLIAELLPIVARAPDIILHAVVAEARFRVRILPLRTPEVQLKYQRDNALLPATP